MIRRSPPGRPDDAATLEPFTVALRDELVSARRRYGGGPDAGDLFERVGFTDAPSAATRAGVTWPSGAVGAATDQDHREALAPFVEVLRAEVEHGIGRRRLEPVPGLPRRGSARRRVFMTGLVLAAAAGLVLVIQWGDRALRGGAETMTQAAHVAPVRPGGGASHGAAPATVTRDEVESRASASSLEGDVRAGPSGESAEASAGVPTVPPASVGSRSDGGGRPVTDRSRKTASHPKGRDAVALTLEEQARARWQAGDLAGAERILRRIIRRFRDSNRAELAYGDLVSLARQRAGVRGQARVWREYLKDYPAGRFAQDAQSGLCRLESGDAAHVCWQRYLAAFPRGTHAAQARRALSSRDEVEP